MAEEITKSSSALGRDGEGGLSTRLLLLLNKYIK